MKRIEQLLNLDVYRNNIEQDPLWDHFPLRTSYHEELTEDVSVQHKKHSLIQGNKIRKEPIGALKKNREEKRLRKMARQAELTDGWYGMKQQQATEEAKNTYVMLKLRKFIDPKNPAKSSEFSAIPKYYQIGTVVNGGGGKGEILFMSDSQGAIHKIPRGKRESSLVDSFLKYDLEKSHSRKKFGELQHSRLKDVQFNKRLTRLRKFSKRIKNK